MTNKKVMNIINAPKVMFDFEQQEFDSIYNVNVDGWNIWQICKAPLFYERIQANTAVENVTKSNKKKGVGKTTPFWKGFSVFKNLIFLILKTNDNQTVYFVTNSADKLSKTENGLFYNTLMYPLLDEKIFEDVLILEEPLAKGFLEPAAYSYHINTRGINMLSGLLSRFLKNKKEKAISKQLSDKLNRYFSAQGFSDAISVDEIATLVSRFRAERILYRLLFKLATPRLIITSEKMPSGFLAAAIEQHIPIVEFQHGGVDEYYPHYVWDRRFLTCQKIMKPTCIAVFGTIAKGIITKTGYFKSDEVIIVGYPKIDLMREANIKQTNKRNILVAVQPLMHNFNIELLKVLLQNELLDSVNILFKAHPLQKEEETSAYRTMLAGSNIQMVDSKTSIHQLIINSDIVVGYFSTTLEEAISLTTPAITICTPDFPKGIHSLTGSNALVDVIRPVELSSLNKMLHDFYTDTDFRKKWIDLVEENKYVVYQAGYKNNIRTLLESLSI